MENDVRCPYCGSNMISGCIASDIRNPLVWIPDNEKEKGFLDRITTEHEVIKKAKLFTKTRLGCYRCLVCNKIVIDLNE